MAENLSLLVSLEIPSKFKNRRRSEVRSLLVLLRIRLGVSFFKKMEMVTVLQNHTMQERQSSAKFFQMAQATRAIYHNEKNAGKQLYAKPLD